MTPPLAIHSVALEGAAPAWVQLIPAGTFRGDDGRGPYRLADPAAVIARSMARLGHLVVDYDHQTDLAAVGGVGGQAPAAGWIVALEERDGALWGRVEWTETGARRIEGREYRYLSPVFAHEKAGGEILQLLRAGLTNKPNLDLVALNHSQTQETASMDEFLTQIVKALGLKPDADQAVALQQIEQVARQAAEAEFLSKIVTQLTGGPVDLAPLHAAGAGPARDKALGDVVVALQAKMAKAHGADRDGDGPQAAQLQETIKALQSEVNMLKAAQASGAAEAAVDAAITAGKLAPAARDWALSYAASEPDGFKSFIEKQPTLVSANATVATVEPPTGENGLTAGQTAICAAMGLTADEFKAAEVRRQG
ncbi:MAG: phage protease [Alphaproteobacteria bacterium]|nr:phage protease [Alphaproteobacteria bacterium]